MKSSRFVGTGVAVITPFHKYGTIDFTSLGRIINHLIEKGVDYLVALGTTSEAPTLTRDERNAVVEYFKETVAGRVPLVVGLGGNNTQDVINQIKQTDFTGIDAILSVTPYYNKPRSKGISIHYRAIANACPVPIILYNVPGRTSCNLPAEVTLELAHELDNIIGIKEASGDLGQIMDIIKGRPKGFLVISGDDVLTYPLMALGADGVISVAAHAFPAEFSGMVRYCLQGDFIKARNIHYRLKDVTNLFFEEGNPSGIKAALESMGLCSNVLRLPLVRVSKGLNLQIKDAMNILAQVSV
jgi:4-hydroxy-tetrahydrodipicolinate synthase